MVTTEFHEGKANCVADFQPLIVALPRATAWPKPKDWGNALGCGRIRMYHTAVTPWGEENQAL